jgi:glyoxylase-like metal-dependent hydrolase (beta-lactamase superfamily II)
MGLKEGMNKGGCTILSTLTVQATEISMKASKIHAFSSLLMSTLAALPVHGGGAEKSYRDARPILDTAIRAAGGLEALQAVKDVRRVSSATTFARGQSLTPETMVTRQVETTNVTDFSGRRSRSETTTAGAGIVTARNLSVVNGDASFNYNLVTRALNPVAAAGATNARNAIGRDPAALLLTMAGRAEALRSLGDDTLEGRTVRVISFADADGTLLTLSFDAASGLLSRIETLAASPVDGDLLNETLLSDYRDVQAGTSRVKLPFRVITRAGGDVTSDLKYTSMTVNAGLADEALAAPKDGIRVPPAAPGAGVTADRLGDDLYRIGGGTHHSLAVGFKDEVVVIEAPQNEARSLAVLGKVKELFPAKRIRLVPTHYHFDHSGGIRTYIAWGLPILTTVGNRAFIEKMAAGKHTIRPDSLARDPKKAVIETFTTKKVLTDGTRTLELHDVGPNPHVGEMVVAYLPKEKALFVADLISIQPGPLAPASPALVDFSDKLTKLGLTVETLVPGHGRVGTMDDLKAALAGRPAQN